jgi:hypothetical protein
VSPTFILLVALTLRTPPVGKAAQANGLAFHEFPSEADCQRASVTVQAAVKNVVVRCIATSG